MSAVAKHSLHAAEAALREFVSRGLDNPAEALLKKFSYKRASIEKYTVAYQNYCWNVKTVEDYKLAPFHIMATEGEVHRNKSHDWHMQSIRKICEADPSTFRATLYQTINT